MNRGVSTIEILIAQTGAPVRLDRALADNVPNVSRERLKTLILSDAVTSGGQIVRDPARHVTGGEQFTIEIPEPRPLDTIAQAIALTVVHEDADLIVIDKPAGLVVHPAAGNPDGTLVNALLHHCGGNLSGIGGVLRPGIVHRIDKDTSGLIVAAKSDIAHEGLSRQFSRHSIERRYRAIVSGIPMPASGTIDAPLARSPSNRKKIAVVKGGKAAITHYRTIQRLNGAALVECRLETGRTHQVRVHMQSIGHPLLGDPVYSRTKGVPREVVQRLRFERQALHAAHLGFIHPVTCVALSFDSPIPGDMQELFSQLHV